MKKLFLCILLSLIWCNIGFAEEIVIYCTEQESTGYHTSSKPYKSSDFYPDRFTAKVDFQNYKLNVDGSNYKIIGEGGEKDMHIYTNGFSTVIRFYDRKKFKFYKSNILGIKDSISISYGTCSKF